MGLFGKSKTKEEKIADRLAYAVERKDHEWIMNYAHQGAKLDVQIGEDATPLVLMVQNMHEQWTRQLLELGANPDFKAKNGLSPLEAALRKGWFTNIRLLIRAGADLDAPFTDGGYAVHAALGYTDGSKLALLLDKGIKTIDARNKDGNTALHLAARAGNVPEVVMLLEHGADPRLENAEGKMPAQMVKDKPGLVAILNGMPVSPLKQAVAGDWQLVNADEVARITTKSALGYRVTEIFNFNARTYTHIARNLETNAESQTIKSFDDIEGGRAVEEARAALVGLGGRAPEQAADKRKLSAPGAA